MKIGEVTFGAISLLETYGLYTGTPNDVLFPPLKERKITIPGRDGRYDYGANTRDERNLSIRFASTRDLTRTEIRELSYTLSKKNIIRIWDEPDKYYRGQIYDSTAIERAAIERSKFTLNFICEPFAYSESVSIPITDGENKIEYKGTAKTPCLIIVNNTSQDNIVNIRISATYTR